MYVSLLSWGSYRVVRVWCEVAQNAEVLMSYYIHYHNIPTPRKCNEICFPQIDNNSNEALSEVSV
jgi:hypothetical protein